MRQTDLELNLRRGEMWIQKYENVKIRLWIWEASDQGNSQMYICSNVSATVLPHMQLNPREPVGNPDENI